MDANRGELRIEIETTPSSEELAVIEAGLTDYAKDLVEPRDYRALTLFLRDAEGRIKGGVRGATVWRWLHLKHLWVAKALRGRGWGRELLETAEQEAVRRGCRQIYLDTFSFQSPDFYLDLGYEPFGVLEDFPPGERRLFLRKTILSEVSSAV